VLQLRNPKQKKKKKRKRKRKNKKKRKKRKKNLMRRSVVWAISLVKKYFN
jgi:hypothetical protein